MSEPLLVLDYMDDNGQPQMYYRDASASEVLAAVRSGVESGTIKLDYEAAQQLAYDKGWVLPGERADGRGLMKVRAIVDAALGIGPVSDGGEDRP